MRQTKRRTTKRRTTKRRTMNQMNRRSSMRSKRKVTTSRKTKNKRKRTKHKLRGGSASGPRDQVQKRAGRRVKLGFAAILLGLSGLVATAIIGFTDVGGIHSKLTKLLK